MLLSIFASQVLTHKRHPRSTRDLGELPHGPSHQVSKRLCQGRQGAGICCFFFPLMAARTKAQHCPGLLHTHTEQIHILSRLFSGFLAILWFVLAKDTLRTKLSE